MISDEQKRMIEYFWKEKGDVRRYDQWDEIQNDLRDEYPALWMAFNQLHNAEIVIDALLKGDYLDEH